MGNTVTASTAIAPSQKRPALKTPPALSQAKEKIAAAAAPRSIDDGYSTDSSAYKYSMASARAPQAAGTVKKEGATTGRAEKNDTIRNLDVVMTPLPGQESKEVILNRGYIASSKNVREFVIADTLEPTEGIAQYNDYVAANLKQPETLAGKTPGGAVRLSFEVDDSGTPVNIAVVNSECNSCNAEAIRLLLQGPKWKKQKNKKGALTIHF
jgi:hypothetical protein